VDLDAWNAEAERLSIESRIEMKPDHSKGVPRDVVAARREAGGFGNPPGASTTCTECPLIASDEERGDDCPNCPGVFVPIIDDPEPEPSPTEDTEA